MARCAESAGTTRRIGLLGGSFNPVHFGHLRAAEEVREQAALDEVWLVLAKQPPHKEGHDIAPPSDRLRMLELALGGVPHLRVETCELERSGPSYTIDTVHELRDAHPGIEISLILGLDAFREIATWHRVLDLLAECDLRIVSRPPEPLPQGPDALVTLDLPIAVREAFWYEGDRGWFRHRSGRRLEFLPMTGLDISASKLRQLVRAERSIRFLTPSGVVEYISSHGLYRSPT